MTFLETAEPLLKAFWYIALPVSLFFLLQTILTFTGFGGNDIDTDFESQNDTDAPFELFSLRNLINFLLGFSWSGISFYSIIENKAILTFLSVVIGVAFVALFFLVIKQLMKLNEDNTFSIDKTLHAVGSVYLTIPERKTGKGKLQISVNGALHELEAMTENESIETGATVKVVKIIQNILIVEKI